ncbi:Similar to hypothetical protein CH063_00527 [Colletotrichum higginsianum]; acc. no. CCF44726 [Pyronema omphalodes CBS 100304]|uniref:Rhodopsin domain-containing protein n=1 Tax=Pyronema omphalodes (strain CBS 100304) TaxID=1076935 RepID=U4LDG7_PYROM|nr:Similar to hypothetical protein CH063_00527 [Colletotrichum higginsianum]; acc. no. CCF44726 [Pyronema omphalodes CBS 100304]
MFCILRMIHFGLGLHVVDVPAENQIIMLKYLVYQEVIYSITNGTIKLSLILMYIRVFTFDRLKWGVIFTGLLTIFWVCTIVPMAIFQCTPIGRAWDFGMPGTCINLKAAFVSTAAINIFNDCAILMLPMPFVWKLSTSMWRRLSLMFIFSLGSFVVFASVYRFTTIFEFDPRDTSWTLARACAWCLVECAAGIISACLPTLRPIVVMISSKFISTKDASDHPEQTIITVGGSAMKNGKRFYRVDDRNLRPKYDDVFVSQISRGEGEEILLDERGGESPSPGGINVKTEVEWSENRSAQGSSCKVADQV